MIVVTPLDMFLLLLSIGLLAIQLIILTRKVFDTYRNSQYLGADLSNLAVDLQILRNYARKFDRVLTNTRKRDEKLKRQLTAFQKYVEENIPATEETAANVQEINENTADLLKTFEQRLDKNEEQGKAILAAIVKGNRESNFDAARIKTRQTNERKRQKKLAKK